MKNVFTLLFLLINLLSLQLFAGNASLRGVVENRLSDSVVISYITYENGNWLDYQQQQIITILNDDNKFSANLPVGEGYTLITIQNGEQATETYIAQDHKLNMTVDASDFDNKLIYTGEGAKIANFMAKHMLAHSFTRNYYREIQEAQAKDPEEFPDAIEELTQRELDFLIEHGADLPQAFIKFWDNNYEYLKYDAMLDYPWRHEMIKQQSYSISNIPDENYTVTTTVPEKFNDKLLPVQSYRSYIQSYYNSQLDAQGVKSTPDNPTLKDDKALELAHQNMPTKSEEYVFATFLRSKIKSANYTEANFYYSKFIERYPNSVYKKMLSKQLDTKKKLSVGQPAIDITFMNENGKKVNLSDLKGNVVYLDFWASWCGPCRAQFPHVKDVKEHFKGKNVVFAYVSIDGSEENWKKAMEKYHLTGLHTLADGEWKSKEAQAYGVQGIPAYFLIDTKGNFATETTPRPSETDKLIEVIEELL